MRIAATLVTLLTAAVLASIAGCAPEVGSERWCEQMRDKPRGDWSTNEALDFARYCILESDDDAD